MTTAADLLGALVLEDGRPWAKAAHDFQRADAEAVLAAVLAPRWHFWLRGRGLSKTTDAAAVAFVLLIAEAPPRSRSYVYAVDEDQAALLLDALVGFAERSGLLNLIEVQARSVTCRASGATLSIEASDSASAFGTRPWLVVADEVALWPDTSNHARLWASIISGLGKVPGSRLLVMTSAGSPSHPSFKRWQAAVEEKHWRASLTPGPSPWWSPEDVEAARRDLTPAEFRRFVLCQWAEADDALATSDDVAACVGPYRVLEPRPGVRYTMALDIGTKRDATVLAVGHAEQSAAGRRVVIDRVQRWRGTRLRPVSMGDVEAAVLACWQRYGRARLIYDPHQAAQLSERLRRAGVRADEYLFTTASVNRLARSLYGALRDRAIELPDDEDLVAELASVRLVERGPGLVKIDHRSGEHDDQAVTVAMLAATLTARSFGPVRMQVPRGRIPTRSIPQQRPEPDPPAVVRDGQPRPQPGAFYRNGRLVIPTSHPGYQPPGRRRDPRW